MFKLKDIFTPSKKEEEVIIENSDNKKDKSISRMNELVKSFEEKNEVIKETTSKKLSEEEENKTRARFAKLSHHRLVEYNESNLMNSPTPVGQTVNSIDGAQLGNGQVASSSDMYKGASVYALTEEEALEVAVKRTLKAGTPVNNLSFYDEVNWNLGTLGFSPKLPIDIKDCIIKCIDAKISE